MIFKTKWIFYFALILSNGCGLRIGEVYAPTTTSTSILGCMNAIDRQFTQYLEQTLPQREINSFSQCLQIALTSFKHYVQGEKRNIYTPDELRNFMHRFFLQDSQISDSLLYQLMNFKTAIAGGTMDQLTNKEIDSIVRVIDTLDGIVGKIYPFNKMLFTDQATTPKDLKKGISVLRSALLEITQIFKNPYSLEDANTLAMELKKLLDTNTNPQVAFTQATLDFLPFILSTKQSNVLLVKEWEPLVHRMVDVFSSYIHYQKSRQSLDHFAYRSQHLSQSIHYALIFLKNIVRRQATAIQGTEVKNLLDRLDTHQLLPTIVTLKSFQKASMIFFGTIAQKSTDPFNFSIGEKEIAWMESEYQRHRTIQNKIDSIYEYDFIPSSFPYNQLESDIHSLSHFRPLYNEANGNNFNAYLLYSNQLPSYIGHKNLTMNSFYWSLVRVIIRGYAKNFPDKGMTQQELIQFLEDIKPILMDLNAASDQTQFSTYHFLAGNLLNYITKGLYKGIHGINEQGEVVELIDEKEGIESLSTIQFIFRTYMTLSESLKALCIDGEITNNCFKRHILSAIQNNMDYTPHLIHYLSNISSDQEVEYIRLLFEIGKIKEPKPYLSAFDKTQLLNVVIALTYQEIMFTKFNVNSDEQLDHHELIDLAFPYYEGLIQYMTKQLTGEPENQYTKEIYSYVVAHRKLPNLQSYWDQTFHIGVIESIRFIDITPIDRLDLMKITHAIVQALENIDETQ